LDQNIEKTKAITNIMNIKKEIKKVNQLDMIIKGLVNSIDLFVLKYSKNWIIGPPKRNPKRWDNPIPDN